MFAGNDDITLHSLAYDRKWIESLPVADITDLKFISSIFFKILFLDDEPTLRIPSDVAPLGETTHLEQSHLVRARGQSVPSVRR